MAWADIIAYLNEYQDFIRIIVMTVVVVLGVIVLQQIYRRLMPRLEGSSRFCDDILLRACYRPLLVYWLIMGSMNLSARVWSYFSELSFLDLQVVQGISLTLTLVWAIYRFINFAVERIHAGKSPVIKHKKFNRSSVYASAYLLKIVVFLLAFMVIMQVLGISVSVFLAFGGLGGLAVAFAAQDMLANLFGGLMIYLDRPFAIGDWIYLPEHKLEGDVVKIGWRLTKVSTFERRPRYVPNRLFSSSIIENPSRMTHRRIKFVLGVEYAALPKMQELTVALRTMLREHPHVDGRQTVVVNFMEYGAYSLNIMIYCMTRSIGFVDFSQSREEVLLSINDVLEQLDIAVAFPTQTLHLKSHHDSGKDEHMAFTDP